MKRFIYCLISICILACCSTNNTTQSLIGTSWAEVADSGYKILNGEKITFIEKADTCEYCNMLTFQTDSICSFNNLPYQWKISSNGYLQIGTLQVTIIELSDSILKFVDNSDTLNYMQTVTYRKVKK